MACLDWAVGGPDRGRQTHAATRLLARHPEIARTSIWTAVACGEIEDVERILRADAGAAFEKGGPRGWPPLLYLCSVRLAIPGKWSENALTIARLLLDHGADPNAYYQGGNEDIHYTAITCLVGRGEEQAAVHPKARELAALLLDRGAEPNDMQFYYNAFAGHASQRFLADDDFVWLLELMYQRSLALGRAEDWKDPDWKMLGMGAYGAGAWYLLSNALKVNALRLAEWALSHGANPNPPRASDHRTPEGSLYEQAVRTGRREFAALLERYGASATVPVDPNMDDRAAIFEAAEQDRVEDVAAILDRGVSPDVEQPKSRTRLLHTAAYSGATRVVALLVERGAEIDPRDATHGTTPIYWAYWGRRPECVDLLAPVSRDVWALVPSGKLDRLRDLLRTEPRLAMSHFDGGTPLFFLPDDEHVAAEIARLFIAHGADRQVRRKDGTTAATLARARGLDEAAELLS
jgi:ankyrin repeat protein